HRGCPAPQYPDSVQAEPAHSEVITLSDVLFVFNQSDLTPTAKSQLDALISKFEDADVVSIKVVGHTDSVGTDAYNQSLSERRASSVAEYLLSQGVAPNKVTSEGKGKSQPIADNETEEGRAKNRRVELHINR
ncbi:MAG: OmpA family protein, partial [Pseudomonas fluorescens]|nr:OmpA family protein [Pseudomonas fluorescens]